MRREVGLPLAHERLSRCATVVGVDPAPDMLRLARARPTGGRIRAAAEHLP